MSPLGAFLQIGILPIKMPPLGGIFTNRNSTYKNVAFRRHFYSQVLRKLFRTQSQENAHPKRCLLVKALPRGNIFTGRAWAEPPLYENDCPKNNPHKDQT